MTEFAPTQNSADLTDWGSDFLMSLTEFTPIVADYQDFLLQNWLILLRRKGVLAPFGDQSGDSDWICSDFRAIFRALTEFAPTKKLL